MIPTMHNCYGLLAADSDAAVLERPQDSSTEVVEGLTFAEATELLDWLEGHDIRASDVRMDETGRMTVAWLS